MRTSSSAPIMATTTRPRSCPRCASCVKAARSARRRRTRSCGRTPSGCTAYSFSTRLRPADPMAGRETQSAPDFFIRSLGLCGLLLSAIALAVESTPEMTRLARYAGADREQVLVRGAQKEGEVTLYAGTQINDMRPVIQAFTKRYGVRVNFWRAGREEILSRVVNETSSGRAGADVIEQSSLTLEMLHREGLLQRVESPAFPTLMPAALAPHREWTAVSLDYVVQAYNTNLVKKSELPQRWEDLLDAKWKGRANPPIAVAARIS